MATAVLRSCISVYIFTIAASTYVKVNNTIPTYSNDDRNIFTLNHTIMSRQNGYGLIKFEGQNLEQDQKQHGHIAFEGQTSSQTNQRLKFEDEISNTYEHHEHGNPLRFEDQNLDDAGVKEHSLPLKFEDLGTPNNPNFDVKDENLLINDGTAAQGVNFQDNNSIEVPHGNKKRKRRRRKPKRQRLPGFGYPGQRPGAPGFPGYAGQLPGFPGPGSQASGAHRPIPGQGFPDSAGPAGYTGPGGVVPGAAGPGFQGQGFPVAGSPGQNPYGYPGYPGGQYYRPPRRQRPSVATEALSAVTGALSSIALYDDYQCVPRLLCEAAGGGALGTGSQGLFQSVAGLQPLLTLLSAYNGISTSPLFVFGRAVFLGMTSKANPGTCRYAYPLCPTDPEQLVHYLNNHNGGFFRFFNAPHLSNPQYGLQNLEQFYNQLSVPGSYGIYQPGNGNQANYDQIGNQPNQGPSYPGSPTGFGIHPNPGANPGFNQFGNPGLPGSPGQNYGIYSNFINQQNSGVQKPQGYSPNYPYAQNYNEIRYKNDGDNNKIEKRIQNNKPIYDDSTPTFDQNPKWLNAEYVNNNYVVNNYNNNRDNKLFKFPEESKTEPQTNTNRITRGFIFPGVQSNREYMEYYSYPPVQHHNRLENNFVSANIQNVKYENIYKYQNTDTQNEMFYNTYKDYSGNDNEGVEIVYIVRGNGDPNHPEIVKVRQGQKIQ